MLDRLMRHPLFWLCAAACWSGVGVALRGDPEMAGWCALAAGGCGLLAWVAWGEQVYGPRG